MTHDVATQEELTAYLDGELDAERRRHLEERLARDPEFRTELQRLQRAWDMLDQLPRTTVDESFAKSTMEVVAVAAEEEARTQALEIPRRRRRGTLLGSLGIAAALVAGLLCGLRPWSNSNRQLLVDLPLVENFDLYRQADSVDFLKKLSASQALEEEASEPPPLADIDDQAKRREHVQQLSVNERQQLLRNQERFNELPLPEQLRMRTLYAEVTHDSESAKLRALLTRYHEWLKTLSPEQRAELADLSSEQRIERITKLIAKQKEEQERKQQRFAGSEPLPPQDRETVLHWFEELVLQHRDELLASLPSNHRDQIEKMDKRGQSRALMFTALHRWRNEPIPITRNDFDHLITRLSPAARERLEKADSPQRRRHLTRDWLLQAMAARWGNVSLRRSLAAVSSEDLERFFQDELPEHDRQRLLNLPRDQMRDELRQLFFDRAGRPEGPPPDRREPPDFRPGPPRPEFGRPRGPRRPPFEGGPDRRPDRPPQEPPPEPRD